jgi:hypothetical protein
MYYVHYIIHGTKGVTFYDVLGELRLIVCVFIVSVMFLESQAALEWGNCWNLIQESILDTVNQVFEKKYQLLDNKISRLAKAQKQEVDKNNMFYPRVINKTNIEISNEELSLLNKGIKYNLGYKQRHWISNLAFEVEGALTLLPPGEQEHIRYQVAQNIKKLQNQQHLQKIYTSQKGKEKLKLVNQIKEKLRQNNALITKADKGNTIVITYLKDYDQKVLNFISDNKAIEVNNNITTKFQKDLRNTK